MLRCCGPNPVFRPTGGLEDHPEVLRHADDVAPADTACPKHLDASMMEIQHVVADTDKASAFVVS